MAFQENTNKTDTIVDGLSEMVGHDMTDSTVVRSFAAFQQRYIACVWRHTAELVEIAAELGELRDVFYMVAPSLLMTLTPPEWREMNEAAFDAWVLSTLRRMTGPLAKFVTTMTGGGMY